ncbi:MAG: hypothetical protein ACLFR8_07740 [Alkalispirochaeta sp.]
MSTTTWTGLRRRCTGTIARCTGRTSPTATAYRITAATVALFVIAGCATAPSPERSTALTPESLEAALAASASVPTPERVTHRGVTVSAPAGYRFESAYGADRGRSAETSPVGVLLRLRDGAGTVSGAVQQVFRPAETDGETVLRRYLETRLNVPDASDVPIREIPAPAGRAVATVVADPDADQPAHRELLVAVYPLGPRVAGQGAILLEIFYPAGSDDIRAAAAAIAESLTVPQVRAEMRIHGRHTADEASPAFEDSTGRWRWVTDAPGGFVARLREPGRDLYLLISGGAAAGERNNAVPQISGRTLRETGMSIELERGLWHWSLPVAADADMDQTWYVVIPGNPPGESPPHGVVITVPGRAWRDGRLVTADDVDPEQVTREVQQFFTDHLRWYQ